MTQPKQFNHKRHAARKLAMQALYAWSINPLEISELLLQFKEDPDYPGIDKDYFTDLVKGVIESKGLLDKLVASKTDRPLDQLDPVELAVLRVAILELKNKIEIPYKVVINEAISLTKKFGGEDGHKYVNAILDKLSSELRVQERTS